MNLPSSPTRRKKGVTRPCDQSTKKDKQQWWCALTLLLLLLFLCSLFLLLQQLCQVLDTNTYSHHLYIPLFIIIIIFLNLYSQKVQQVKVNDDKQGNYTVWKVSYDHASYIASYFGENEVAFVNPYVSFITWYNIVYLFLFQSY